MNYKVSIITPSYNRAGIINDTASSIFRQTYANWEWIIVDDGSTDNSWEIINQYALSESRTRVFKREREPKGACTCRNIGVENSTGKYLLFLDSDDVIEPFCLENRVRAMQNNPELDFAIFPSLMFEVKPYDLQLWWNIDKPQSELTRQFYQDAICQGTGILITKDAFLKVGLWDEELTLWQDIDLFFRLYIQKYKYKKFFDLPADLHNRINPASLSRSAFFRLDKLDSRVKVIEHAAILLVNSQQQGLLRELRFMLAEVISGYLRIKDWKKASKLMDWGLCHEIIDNGELVLLKRLKVIHQFKLNKFIGVKNYLSKIALVFTAPIQITLGILPTNSK